MKFFQLVVTNVLILNLAVIRTFSFFIPVKNREVLNVTFDPRFKSVNAGSIIGMLPIVGNSLQLQRHGYGLPFFWKQLCIEEQVLFDIF